MNTKIISRKLVSDLIVLIVYFAFLLILWPFNQAIIFAIMFAFALNPLLERLEKAKRFGLTGGRAALFLIFSMVAVFFIPLGILIFRVINMVNKFSVDQLESLPIVQKAQDVANTVLTHAQQTASHFGLDLTSQFDFKAMAAQYGKVGLGIATATATNIPEAIFQFLIFLALIYYFLMNKHSFKRWITDSRLITHIQINRLSQLLQSVCNMVLISTLLIAVAQGLIVAATNFFVGYEGFLIIFMITFFISFLPVLGSAPMTILLIAYSLVSGHYGIAVVFCVVGVFAGTIDNVIKAILFSSAEDSVHPLIALLSIIGSLAVFGVTGLFLGPIISELAVKIGPIFTEPKPIVSRTVGSDAIVPSSPESDTRVPL